MEPNSKDLMKLVNYQMPFGRYKGLALLDLPEPYVVWFCNNHTMNGEIGTMMKQLYEIKANGLEGMLNPLRDYKRSSQP